MGIVCVVDVVFVFKLFEGVYFFVYMMYVCYGVLYYVVSCDGLYWMCLNKGKVVNEDYYGYFFIVQGFDGCYYFVGN